MNKKYEIAAYYFPNFHPDTRNSMWHGPGWTEWELLKHAIPRFDGHSQPKIPLWGYEDESKPEVAEKKIEAAVDHNVTAFIYDWYWYEDGPFLQRALEDGFLRAGNNHRLKFALMWANHDWCDMHPAQRSRPCNIHINGAISKKAFIEATNHMIEKYFNHPSYWRVDGGLYLSIYDLSSLIKGFEGVDNTCKMLNDFRTRVRAAGLGELHLNAVVWGIQLLPEEKKIDNVNELLDKLNFNSVTSYVWLHHNELMDFPKTSYVNYRDISVKDFNKFTEIYNLPYHPNVTMGWDTSPRTIQSDVYQNTGYPAMPILDGNTPKEFEKALQMAKDFLDKGCTKSKILTINAWNEWTEGSYLEPDEMYGYEYLEAIKRIFGN